MEDNTGHGARRAIEALRSGVPNRDVVKQLGVFQGDVTQKFTELREDTSLACQQGDERGRHMVISGGFGSGKSHLLEYLRHQALEHNCVCSYVVVSKETPLFDLTRLYRSAAETATVPGRAGRAIPEILARSDEAGLGRFAHLCEWAQNQPEYQNRFVPLLHILLESTDRDEIVNQIAREWSGYPLKVSRIRTRLKDIGRHKEYRDLKVALKELAVQLWSFLPRFFHAAGYNGWVVLFDEVELMLRYSRMQRARSYANIARLAGKTEGFRICGLLPVFAITDDFQGEAEKKGDHDMPEWLRSDRYLNGPERQLATDVELGMKLLSSPMILRSARSEELEELKEKLRRLHSRAFEWDAPPPMAREELTSSSIRQRVKSWITQWDLALLYPGYRPDITAEKVTRDYSEDSALTSKDEQEDIAPGWASDAPWPYGSRI